MMKRYASYERATEIIQEEITQLLDENFKESDSDSTMLSRVQNALELGLPEEDQISEEFFNDANGLQNDFLKRVKFLNKWMDGDLDNLNRYLNTEQKTKRSVKSFLDTIRNI